MKNDELGGEKAVRGIPVWHPDVAKESQSIEMRLLSLDHALPCLDHGLPYLDYGLPYLDHGLPYIDHALPWLFKES